MREINTRQLRDREFRKTLRAGEAVSLSGIIYTARDQAHKRLAEAISRGSGLPFDLTGAVIYYAGPTAARPPMIIGSCGPTTSGRMDAFTPTLLGAGVCAAIGKGPRSDEVRDAFVKNGAVYFCAVGGAGCVAAESIKSVEVVAFPELGCEAIRRMKVEAFPVIVGIDASGNDITRLNKPAVRPGKRVE